MSRGWGVESVSTSIAPGITKNDSSSTAPEAISQPINGCAAQHSGQLLMFEGKSCSHGRSFTSCHLVNDLKVRRDRPQGSNCALKVRSSKNLHGRSRFWSQCLPAKNGSLCCFFYDEK